MERICYFNITYSCNNACVYCFSFSTGMERRNISIEDFKLILETFNPTKKDKVIINGGEPTIHPSFYDMLAFINQNYSTNIVVYSNGVNIDVEKIEGFQRIQFVIPIHGYSTTHDTITRHIGSFEKTVKNLQKLQEKNIKYSIKFIANKDLIDSEFNVFSFLKDYRLKPFSIVMARLNATKKSIENMVSSPSLMSIKNFIQQSHKNLRHDYKIVYLDIPFCLLPVANVTEKIYQIPEFYFSDYKEKLKKCCYYKHLLLRKEKCQNCHYRKYCSLMETSYLTLVYDKSWNMELE